MDTPIRIGLRKERRSVNRVHRPRSRCHAERAEFLPDDRIIRERSGDPGGRRNREGVSGQPVLRPRDALRRPSSEDRRQDKVGAAFPAGRPRSIERSTKPVEPLPRSGPEQTRARSGLRSIVLRSQWADRRAQELWQRTSRPPPLRRVRRGHRARQELRPRTLREEGRCRSR